MEERGRATAIEYGLIAALIAVAAIAAMQLVGTSLTSTFNNVARSCNDQRFRSVSITFGGALGAAERGVLHFRVKTRRETSPVVPPPAPEIGKPEDAGVLLALLLANRAILRVRNQNSRAPCWRSSLAGSKKKLTQEPLVVIAVVSAVAGLDGRSRPGKLLHNMVPP